MKNRVRLRFDRNKDIRTEYYHIYRSNSAGVNRRDPLIMKVKHTKNVNPIEMKGDTALFLQGTIYQLHHSGIVMNMNHSVYIDGILAPESLYQIKSEEGMIIFYHPLEATSVVTADYYFDGIEVIDDSVKQEWVLDYYGPYAEDGSNPTTPINVSMLVQNNQGNVKVSYRESVSEGQYYYYRIEARGNNSYSNLSPEYKAMLKANILSYQIEASHDGTKWLSIGSTPDLFWLDNDVDNEPPEPVSNGTALVEPIQNTGTAYVHFNWNVPLVNSKSSYTPMYRVRAKTDAGVLSSPSLSVGPELVKSDLDKVVLRRKVSDGFSWPSYDGTDAVTVAEVIDLNLNNITDTVQDSTIYAYSLFVVDKAGNVSPAITFEVAVEKSSAPLPISGIEITDFNFIV